MAIKVARGQVTIIDQSDAVSLQAFIGSSQPLTQVYNKDTSTYIPSWVSSPYLVLTPALFVSGKGAVDQITSVGNAATLTPGIKSGSAKWYKNGALITSGQDSCTVGAASAKYTLTVKANHMAVAAPQVRYAFEAIYIDANGLEIAFRSEIQFTQHLSAGATITAVAYAPDGVVFKNDEVPSLKAHCDLWRGAAIDSTDVAYGWGIKDSSVFAPTTLTAAATAGATTITVASVTNMEAGGKTLDSIFTIHDFVREHIHEGRNPDLGAERRRSFRERRIMSLLPCESGNRMGVPDFRQPTGRNGWLDDQRDYHYGGCGAEFRDFQVRHQGYRQLFGQCLGG